MTNKSWSGKKIVILSLISITFISLCLLRFNKLNIKNQAHVIAQRITIASLRKYTEQELAPFNGTDPGKPIYIGLNGLVYDVSAGREFYQVGGPYHDIAGRDSSKELNLIGGAIIKRKYPVVGKL